MLHFWQPFRFAVGEGYNYRRDSLPARAGTVLLRGGASVILFVYNKLAFGYRIYGKENLNACRTDGVITVCNHVHPMDCTMVDLAMHRKRMYYITLESNFRIPVVRHLIRILGGVPLSPNPHYMKEMFAEMGNALRAGAAVQIYPEGVLIPYCKELRKFKTGAFYMAVENQIPILPLIIVQKEPDGIFKWYKRKPCLQLHILPPLYPPCGMKKKEAIEKMRRDCMENMMRLL